MSNTRNVESHIAAIGLSILVIGCGRMGGAIISGWLHTGVKATSIHIVDPNSHSLSALAEQGVHLYTDALEVDEQISFDLALVALKPQVFPEILPLYKKLIDPTTLVVSIAAGVQNSTINSLLLDNQPVIRIMPNTPALVNKGVMVACPNNDVNELQKETCEILFSSLGNFYWLQDEQKMHAVTAVSGSGPAYVFHFIEAMVFAAIESGLPQDLARKIAIDTVIGATKLVENDLRDVSELRNEVTSPNGTTAAALDVLMSQDKLKLLLNEAVGAAAIRSVELG